MALPLPHPTQEKGLHTTQQVLFSGLCNIYEKPASLTY